MPAVWHLSSGGGGRKGEAGDTTTKLCILSCCVRCCNARALLAVLRLAFIMEY